MSETSSKCNSNTGSSRADSPPLIRSYLTLTRHAKQRVHSLQRDPSPCSEQGNLTRRHLLTTPAALDHQDRLRILRFANRHHSSPYHSPQYDSVAATIPSYSDSCEGSRTPLYGQHLGLLTGQTSEVVGNESFDQESCHVESVGISVHQRSTSLIRTHGGVHMVTIPSASPVRDPFPDMNQEQGENFVHRAVDDRQVGLMFGIKTRVVAIPTKTFPGGAGNGADASTPLSALSRLCRFTSPTVNVSSPGLQPSLPMPNTFMDDPPSQKNLPVLLGVVSPDTFSFLNISPARREAEEKELQSEMLRLLLEDSSPPPSFSSSASISSRMRGLQIVASVALWIRGQSLRSHRDSETEAWGSVNQSPRPSDISTLMLTRDERLLLLRSFGVTNGTSLCRGVQPTTIQAAVTAHTASIVEQLRSSLIQCFVASDPLRTGTVPMAMVSKLLETCGLLQSHVRIGRELVRLRLDLVDLTLVATEESSDDLQNSQLVDESRTTRVSVSKLNPMHAIGLVLLGDVKRASGDHHSSPHLAIYFPNRPNHPPVPLLGGHDPHILSNLPKLSSQAQRTFQSLLFVAMAFREAMEKLSESEDDSLQNRPVRIHYALLCDGLLRSGIHRQTAGSMHTTTDSMVRALLYDRRILQQYAHSSSTELFWLTIPRSFVSASAVSRLYEQVAHLSPQPTDISMSSKELFDIHGALSILHAILSFDKLSQEVGANERVSVLVSFVRYRCDANGDVVRVDSSPLVRFDAHPSIQQQPSEVKLMQYWEFGTVKDAGEELLLGAVLKHGSADEDSLHLALCFNWFSEPVVSGRARRSRSDPALTRHIGASCISQQQLSAIKDGAHEVDIYECDLLHLLNQELSCKTEANCDKSPSLPMTPLSNGRTSAAIVGHFFICPQTLDTPVFQGLLQSVCAAQRPFRGALKTRMGDVLIVSTRAEALCTQVLTSQWDLAQQKLRKTLSLFRKGMPGSGSSKGLARILHYYTGLANPSLLHHLLSLHSLTIAREPFASPKIPETLTSKPSPVSTARTFSSITGFQLRPINRPTSPLQDSRPPPKPRETLREWLRGMPLSEAGVTAQCLL